MSKAQQKSSSTQPEKLGYARLGCGILLGALAGAVAAFATLVVVVLSTTNFGSGGGGGGARGIATEIRDCVLIGLVVGCTITILLVRRWKRG